MLTIVIISLSLVNAIIEVESGGDNNAIGDNGRAIGCMQIWKCVWEDVKHNEEFKGLEYEDVKKREVALKVFHAYMKRYATKKRLGREPTDEDRARIWNGGPNGYKKKCTEKYWSKVRKVMEND